MVMNNNVLSGEALFQDIVTYYQLGEHRTATESDLRTSQWLRDELQKAGIETSFQSFTLRQFFTEEISLKVGRREIDCFPFWPPCPTENSHLEARLELFRPDSDLISLEGKIVILRLLGRSGKLTYFNHKKLITKAAEKGARAIIAITEGPSGEVTAINSAGENHNWPLPVLLVGQKDETFLIDAAQSQKEASFILKGHYNHSAKARNVIGYLNRGNNNLVVISTPHSGWFRCAGERGPGIAMFLGLARWFTQHSTQFDFLFVTTSGHEIGHYGMQSFMRGLAPPPKNVACWIHLGSSIANRKMDLDGNELKRTNRAENRRRLSCTPYYLAEMVSAFSHVEDLEISTGYALGELKDVIEKGYPSFGFFGSHLFFHTRLDGPETTEPELLEPVAKGLVKALELIEKKIHNQ